MSIIVLDANAVIMHGRAFSDRAVSAAEQGQVLVLPGYVKRELVDDVLETNDAPPNHEASARAIRELIDEGYLSLRRPDFEQYGGVVDEARRRIADDSLPEHAVKADQYIPAIVCELAETDPVVLVTADGKLRRIVSDIAERHGVSERVTLADPLTVL